MAFMSWSDDFSVGVGAIDDDHRKLIDLINELYDALCMEASADAIDEVCARLVEDTVRHFRNEERFFNDMEYPRASAHRAMHEHLELRAAQFRQEIGHTDSVTGLRFLKEFLTHHIQGEDKRLGAYLNEHGIH
jgi:hemerythrin